jgi:hypothetical protein
MHDDPSELATMSDDCRANPERASWISAPKSRTPLAAWVVRSVEVPAAAPAEMEGG